MHYSWAMKKEWQGFRPTAYWLNTQRVFGLGLIRVERIAAGEELATSVTMKDAIDTVCSQTIKEFGWPTGGGRGLPLLTEVTTETGEHVFDGPRFNQYVLRVLLELRKDGINAFAATWFWYETCGCMDEPMESYEFFVVHNERIVRERVSLHDYHGSGFDPSIFTAADDSKPIWSGERGWEDARLRFWYRKFYKETERGQLIVLRTDEPELHHFPEGRWRPDLALGLIQDQLQDQMAKTRSMLESRLAQVQSQLTDTHGLLRWVILALVAVLVAILVGRR